MAASWERLAFVTQPSGDSSTFDSGTFTNTKTHLRVVAHLLQDSPVEADLRFGYGSSGTIDDNANRYAVRISINGGSDLAQYNNLNRIYLGGINPSGGAASSVTQMNILNIATQEKLAMIEQQHNGGDGAGNASTRRETVGKWTNNTDQITKIQFVDLGVGAEIEAGSTITVWGADDATLNYPNITNGTIFEESDTGKHYMFDGTSAWNEIT